MCCCGRIRMPFSRRQQHLNEKKLAFTVLAKYPYFRLNDLLFGRMKHKFGRMAIQSKCCIGFKLPFIEVFHLMKFPFLFAFKLFIAFIYRFHCFLVLQYYYCFIYCFIVDFIQVLFMFLSMVSCITFPLVISRMSV